MSPPTDLDRTAHGDVQTESLFLDERLQPVELAGAVLIIGGIVLVNARAGQRPLFTRAQAG